MKKASSILNSIKNNRKLRCGAYAVLLTIAVILLVLLLNRLAGLAEDRFALVRDYSFNSLTVQSETTRSVLSQLDEDVHIYFVHTNAGLTSSQLTPDDILLTLRRYQSQTPRLSWSEEDIVRNPSFQTQFSDQLTGRAVTANCLVITCGATGRVRVLDECDFIARAYDMETGSYYISGYTLEKSVTEAILYVSSRDVPTLQVLSGHGELTNADLANLYALLNSNSFEVQRVSVLDTLNPEDPILIACPQFDLTEDELNALIDYAKKGGSFLVLSRYSDPAELSRFNQLYLYFGLRMIPGLCVAQAEDTASYYNGSPAILAPYMQSVPELVSLTQSGRDYLLMTGARAFEALSERDSTIFTESLLKSGSAYIHQVNGNENAIDKAEGDPEGYFDLSVYARRYYDDRSSSRMIMIGNADMFCEQWLMENTYSPEFLLAVMNALGGENSLNLDIVQKNAVRAPLRSSARALPAILALSLPFIVLLIAAAVLIPRRNL